LLPTSFSASNYVRGYKPFIDGLRAIAILTVVGSHVDLPGFGGGYIGVDIFFVISGFLIINQIIADIGARRFSLFDFWARRAFRILPGFLLVMVACLVAATVVFVQPEHKEFAESFFLTSLMLANHHFLAHQGYFDMAAFTKPLLHMWSLGVEEQFYFVAPFMLLGMIAVTVKANHGNASRAWIGGTFVMAIVSFAICVAFTFPFGRPNVSFYIMPARGWEFILGGAASYFALKFQNWPKWLNSLIALLGIGAIVLTVAFYTPDTLYPSYRAALPALAAMLIIVAGLADPRNPVARLLATWPLVRIGLISYAWYLWHWPLISFARSLDLGGDDATKLTIAVALSLFLAFLTYAFVELPIRRWRRRMPLRPSMVVAGGIVACLFVGSSGYFWALHFAPLNQPQLAGLQPYQLPHRDYPAIVHRGVLLGDSEAYYLQTPLNGYARALGASVKGISRAGCPPLLGVHVYGSDGNEALFCRPFFKSFAFEGAEFLILAVRWNYYLGLKPSDPFYPPMTLNSDPPAGGAADPYALMARGLAETLSRAKSAGVGRILIIAPVPEFPWYAPFCVMRAIRTGTDGCEISRVAVDARRERTMVVLRRVIAGINDVRLIDPIDLFCTSAVCRPNVGRTLYFLDTVHLSTAGAAYLFEAYQRDFRWALTGDE
jgi:peptidoglycan/LPS O-acetylase OafA/YrhL